MNNLIPIEHRNQRVLTTKQLAEFYESDPIKVQQNFNNNRDRYIPGKHYYLLEGEELKAFKSDLENFEVAANINRLYLWTEKGAWLHAKSLNTDKAWGAYEMLVDTYYEVKDKVPALDNLSPQLQLLINMEIQQKHLALEIASTKEEIQEIREVVTIVPGDTWREDTNRLISKICKKVNNYQEPKQRIYKALEERAGCNLKIRLENMRGRAALEGMPKSKLNGLCYLDVIANDVRLREIYIAIVKEMAIRYGIAA